MIYLSIIIGTVMVLALLYNHEFEQGGGLMDKPEMYVSMADCEEVQGQHGYRQGFYAIDDKIAKPYLVRNEGKTGSRLGSLQWTGYIVGMEKGIYFFLANYPPLQYIPREEWKKFTWLPTQDQIQGMFNWQVFELAWRFEKYLKQWVISDFFEEKTFEQLWIEFYMHEKHSKTWDGEKWEKDKQKPKNQ